MEPTDLTIEVLNGIRQEVHALREETGERLDTLTRRIVESEVRTSTAIADLAGTVREMTGVLRQANELRPRVERCEHDIEEIKRRVG